MKVILARPRYASHIITPPLGLGYLAAFLNKNGVNALIVDALKEDMDNRQLVDHIVAQQADAVGITCLTAFYREVVDLSRQLKQAGQTVIIGGVHPTFLPRQTLDDSNCDYVVLGEGELALARLAQNGFVNDGIPGVYARADLADDRVSPTKAERIDDLDQIPFPDWEQLDPRSYPKAPHGAVAKDYPIGVVTTTRGCPYACTFCASPRFYDRTIRFRTPENVIAEITYLVDRFGVREIHFEDDNFTLRRAHAEALCRRILESGLRISWACPNGVRADTIDEALLRLMKASGCYWLAYGIESANQTILDTIQKNERIDTMAKSIELTARAGIASQGFFVFGLPGETAATIDESIRFAKRSKLSRALFLILDILPGSELWYTLEGKFTPDWDKDSYKEPEWIPEGLTRQCLLKAQSRALREFYLKSPRRLAQLLRHARPGQIKYFLHRLRGYRLLRFRR